MYIVDEIIKKAENSTKDWREGATGKRTRKIHEKDFEKIGRVRLFKELEELEKKGFLKIKRYSPSEPYEISYQIEKLSSFYELKMQEDLLFKPKQQIIREYQQLLEIELEKGVNKAWIKQYYIDLLGVLEKGEIHDKVGKVKTDLKNLHDFVPVFRAIDDLKEPVLIKVFSKIVLHNAKRFQAERMDSKVVSVVKRYKDYLEGYDEAMSEKEILSQLLIEDIGAKLTIKGPLLIRLVNQIDLSSFKYGVELNAQTLRNAIICQEQPYIKKIVTIENETYFLAAHYEENTVYIYTHGFFSPIEKKFLIQLEEILKNQSKSGEVEYYHSGDLDYGGIRIYNYIKKNIFPDLQPLYMDVDIYEKYLEYAEDIEVKTLESLEKMEVPEELEPLARAICSEKKIIEQESFLIKE